MKKFAASLTRSEMDEARSFEKAGLTTISQAVKAFERQDDEQIAEWRRQLAEKQAEKSRI